MATNSLARFIEKSDTKELERLAKLAGTTVGNLRQIAGGYRSDPPRVTALLASRIDRAVALIRGRKPELPEVRRESLSPACSRCEFAKRCRKA